MSRGLDALASRALYKEYLRRIDPESVLDHYGVDIAFWMGDEA